MLCFSRKNVCLQSPQWYWIPEADTNIDIWKLQTIHCSIFCCWCCCCSVSFHFWKWWFGSVGPDQWEKYALLPFKLWFLSYSPDVLQMNQKLKTWWTGALYRTWCVYLSFLVSQRAQKEITDRKYYEWTPSVMNNVELVKKKKACGMLHSNITFSLSLRNWWTTWRRTHIQHTVLF